MMGVLTLPIWKSWTCLTLPVPALIRPRSAGSTSSALKSPGSGSNRIVRSWPVVWSGPISGAAAADLREPLMTRCFGGWRTSCWAGDPTTLEVTVGRYRCTGRGHVWRQDTNRAAEPRATLSRRGWRSARDGAVCQHLTVARVAEGLALSWRTANDAVLAENKRLLVDDPHRLDGAHVLGVDARVAPHPPRRQVRHRDHRSHPIRDGTGPARLVDMVEGCSKQPFNQWLSEREEAGSAAVEVVAMDGFWTATTEELPRRRAGHGPLPRRPLGRATPWTSAAAASSRPRTATVDARTTRSTPPAARSTPARTCSPTSRRTDSPSCSPTTPTSCSRQPGASTSG